MKKIKLTVIMPLYNTGNKLKSAVNSILKQDFMDFELLLIDDGSTDSVTKEICEGYSRKDPRVKVFTKENEGIEKTKVFAIHKAQGEYMVFSDHDDCYLPGAFSKLVSIVAKTDADIVAGNYYEQFLRFLPLRTKGFTIDKPINLSHDEFMNRYYINFFGVNLFNVSTWAKIYKTSLLKDIAFKTLGYNTTEDVALNIQIFPKAKRIVFINDFLYVHIRGGITSKPNPALLLKNYEDLYELKQEYITQYKFSKALPYINYEMKNIFQHYVKLSVERNISLADISYHLQQFKNTNTYEAVASFYQEKLDDCFMRSYISSDYKTIYNDALIENKKITIRKIVKKLVNKF